MNPFEMVVAIVAIVCIARFLSSAIHHKLALREKMMGCNQDLEDRLKRLEQRMANLETIVLDRDKKSEFERSL